MSRVLIAIAWAAASAGVACSSATPGSEVVARIGDRAVTLQELDDRWRAAQPAEHAEATQTTYQGRRRALEALVAESLLADAARKAGVATTTFEEEEIARRSEPVTPDDVSTFYTTNAAQMQDRPLEEMRPLIEEYLRVQRRADARHRLLADLQGAAPPVTVTLEPPRRTVEIQPTDPAIGDQSAPVTLVEFSDFECPFCQRVAPTLRQLRDAYGDRLRIVWKDFPLTQIHPQAYKAAEAAHCAGDQGRYWEYHDRLFDAQPALAPDRLAAIAAEIGLDTAAFGACLDSSQHAARIREGMRQGTSLGVTSTPTIFINGRVLTGAHPYETFAAIIDEELGRK